MLPRLTEWWNRIHAPSTAGAALGFGSEYWFADAKRYEGWEQLRDRLAQVDHKPTNRTLTYHLTAYLLEDVVVAAGGVERAFANLLTIHRDLCAYAAKYSIRATHGESYGLGHQSAIEALYAFADLLVWSRAVLERLDRAPGDRKHGLRQGLIPAIKPKRLQKRCAALVERLRRGSLGQSRLLTNFMLHSALIRHPFSGVQVDASGLVSLPIPDIPTGTVSHWYLLTWKDKRDGFAFAEQLWQELQSCIDDLLAAFEDAVPERLRKQS